MSSQEAYLMMGAQKIRESATTLYALAVVLFMFVFSGEPPAEMRFL